jgi:hypothetical protein
MSGARKVAVKSTYEYQDLVATCFLRFIPAQTVKMVGSVLSYEPLDDAFRKLAITAPPFSKKRAMLLFESAISGSYTRAQAASLYDQLGETAYILCTLGGAPGWTHRTKAQLPSPKKVASLEERLKFSSTQAAAEPAFVKELLASLAPDFQDNMPASFSSLRIVNTYLIEELVFPPNRDRLSSAELRLQTKRKGRLNRQLVVDGKEYLREHPFAA